MAYEFGAGDYRKLRQVIANSAILACLGSVVMLALMQARAAGPAAFEYAG